MLFFFLNQRCLSKKVMKQIATQIWKKSDIWFIFLSLSLSLSLSPSLSLSLSLSLCLSLSFLFVGNDNNDNLDLYIALNTKYRLKALLRKLYCYPSHQNSVMHNVHHLRSLGVFHHYGHRERIWQLLTKVYT